MKKRLLAALMAGAMALSMTACGGSSSGSDDSNAASGGDSAKAGSYKVGVVQLVQHVALDAATQGFQDKLTELVEADGGKVKFDLPAGTQPGTVMSLKGKGIQYLNSRGRGDQYIRIIVEVPKDLTAPQREALKNFKDTMGYSDVTPDEKRGFFGKKKK